MKILVAGFFGAVFCVGLYFFLSLWHEASTPPPPPQQAVEDQKTLEERCLDEDARQGVKRFYENYAIDPESVRFRNWRIHREHWGCRFYVVFEVNAKNTFGGYTGWQTDELKVRYEGNEVFFHRPER